MITHSIEGTNLKILKSEVDLCCRGCGEDFREMFFVGFEVYGLGFDPGPARKVGAAICFDCIRAAAAIVMQIEEGKMKI